ncbi:protein phosphatase 2C domain-containing protein [Kitasatospora sp. NBC_01287]|uniref:protein phosphatase 2C domain-containing protein n=1 Tax=Kitasatospora sp. NBC_01287 TaxID=2903573 RepID=UPI0022593EC6|nr:protein phosphatase 2C domain-containing protein [Kitasatospora sp. NBC_01287]MCX4749789.1 protein phosphatase 2C domain-containing protein [Kitasatospora sp. NBC_01287]
MTDQGAPAQRRPDEGTPKDGAPEDGWWTEVYEGPAGRLPDTPRAGGGAQSVDDWFDSIASAVGLIGQQRQVAGEAEAVAAEAEAEAVEREPEPAPEPVSVPVPVPVPAPEPEPALPKLDLTKPAAPAKPAPAPTPTPTPTLTDIPAPAPTRPPAYGYEPTLLPAAHPERVAAIVPDTALDGAQYPGLTLRAASVRGDSARHRGAPRGDALLVTRFGDAPDGLLLAVIGSRARPRVDPRADQDAPATAAEQQPSDTVRSAAAHLAEAIGRSRAELAADLREGARDRLRYGLQRLTTGAAAGLRALAPDTGSLHCLLVPLDPRATHRAAFGVGPGGLYLLRAGHWIDAYAARLLHHPDGPTTVPEPRPFRFRLIPAGPGDILLLCSPGLAEPIAEEPAVAHFLAGHWSHPHPPGTVDFLRQVQVRAKGYADDRTAVALWSD